MSQTESPRLPYEDPATPHDMYADCRAVGDRLRIPEPRRTRPEAVRQHRANHWDVPDRTAAFAGAMHLHLD